MVTYRQLISALKKHKPRSAWDRGVKKYAVETVERLDPNMSDEIDTPFNERVLLNGAMNWRQYSEGGASLIYDKEIAERLCSPSELKKLHVAGWQYRRPNSQEDWLQAQARALYQASNLVLRTYQALRESRR